MKNVLFNSKIFPIIASGLMFFSICSCKKDQYYLDTGKSVGTYQGTALQYFKSNPLYFDTIVNIIQLAGMEKEFSTDTMTFFAPVDYCIGSMIRSVNKTLFTAGKDTLLKLSDVQPQIWRKYLSYYLFNGANKLKDYPQVDFSAFTVYPGQYYYSYSGNIFDIGVVFNNAGGVKYAGYRQLTISFIPDIQNPNTAITSRVVTSDLVVDHAVIHVLDPKSILGFDINNITQDIRLTR